MPVIVSNAQQSRRQAPFYRKWLVGMTMAYVLVLQLVLSALASVGHAAARLDPATPVGAAILCSTPGQSAPTVPDVPASAMGDGCASFCSPLQPQIAGNPAAPEPHLWQLPVAVTFVPGPLGRPHLYSDRARQPRAPPA